MRLSFGAISAPALVMLGIGCNTVDPSECWPNTSGGFGGSETIPIGAGVGATSGDFLEPPRGPLDNGGTPNPCVVKQSDGHDSPGGQGKGDDGAGVPDSPAASERISGSVIATRIGQPERGRPPL